MPDGSSDKHIVMDFRRRFSLFFWDMWRKLPISRARRDMLALFVFRRMPFLVSWTKTYKNWKTESERTAAQLARMPGLDRRRFDPALESRPRVLPPALYEPPPRSHPEPVQAPKPERTDRRSAQNVQLPEDVVAQYQTRPDYVELSALPRPDRMLARAIAFYLPQFHPIPENDRWWGKGFTEWSNVRRARPQFEGHRQPRRPAELGYYDLLADPDIRRRQASLAHQYGLEGFCFYYYWFGGRQLLEQPVDAYAQDETINFPYCLCWANESWSRRWDGREDQMLIAQYHSPEDDIAFIRNISRYITSSNYLHVGGRPLVIVYRPDLLPDARASAKRWREWCRNNDVGEIFLAYTLSFANGSPQDYGFDAAIEFAPNNMGLPQRQGMVTPAGDDFAARIYDLTDLPGERTPYQRPGFKLFRGVTPQWDNTARRMNNAAVMLDAGPDVYEQWLRSAANDMAKRESRPEERLVFINAWNEWAEGAYLEPDSDYGYAWLAATRRALSPPRTPLVEPASLVSAVPVLDQPDRPKIILMVHDLWRNGAQIHSLNLARVWSRKYGYEVTTIAGDEGPLRPHFEAYGRLLILKRDMADSSDLSDTLEQLKSEGFDRAVINSSAGGWITPHLAEAGIECLGLVHELPEVIRGFKIEDGIEGFEAHARHVIFPADVVQRRSEEEILEKPWSHPVIQPQGLYKTESILHLEEKDAAAAEIRARLSLLDDAIIIVGVGYGDHRKGPDIFCRWAIEAARQNNRLYFLWIGGLSNEMRADCYAILANAGALADHVRILGFQSDTATFFKAAYAYALTSREDPFPSTVLEALACGTPAFIVSSTTGLVSLARSPAIIELPDHQPETFAASLGRLIKSPPRYRKAAQAGMDLIRESFGFVSFAGDLLRLAGAYQPRISVIVPNYNYARFLAHRIASILNQEMPVWEIIFLDDASTDDSLAVAEKLLKDCGVHYRIVPNTENSGSVFAQWQKGVKLARGDIIWIAEADDWAAASFTRVAAEAFQDEDVVLSYTQSNMVSQDSQILAPHYLDYVADISRERWRRPFVHDGADELAEGLSVKNTIPNVSGVMFRREALAAALSKNMKEIRSYRVAGDWCVYAHLAALGKIAFDPRPLNYHRRHATSVTISRFTKAEWDEIARMQTRVQALAEVPDAMKETAQAYLDELAKRL